jgi:hypothetical protein
MKRALLGVLCITVLCPVLGRGQGVWIWPEKPKNLHVLPKEWPGSRLRPVMIGFTKALGVRCSYCHKGEEGMSTYDFASDENPNKNRAREMYRMLSEIDEHLKRIEPSGDKRVNMVSHVPPRAAPADDARRGTKRTLPEEGLASRA